MKIPALIIIIALMLAIKLNAQGVKQQNVGVDNTIKQLEKANKLIAFRLVYDENKDTPKIKRTKTMLGESLVFNYVDFDSSNSIRNNTFHVPETGLYQIDIRVEFFIPGEYPAESMTDKDFDYSVFYVDLDRYLFLYEISGQLLEEVHFKRMVFSSVTTHHSMAISTVIKLTKGMFIVPSFSYGMGYDFASFSGFKIK